jgi:hypothetical protein
MTERVNLHLGTAYCSSLLCSDRSLDTPWAYNCSTQRQYRHLHFCQYRMPIGSLWYIFVPFWLYDPGCQRKNCETTLTLILGHGYDLVVCIFA